MQEGAAAERGLESSEVEEDVAALGLLQRSADSDQERASDSEESGDDEVLVSEGLPKSMSFPLDYYNLELAGKLKRIKRKPKVRGLWPEGCLVLKCPTAQNKLGCNPKGGCCARRVLEEEGGLQGQKGRLQEEVEGLGYHFPYPPGFHFGLGFIERYLCQAKWLQGKIVGTTLKH